MLSALSSEELVLLSAVIAIQLSEGLSNEEVSLLAALFNAIREQLILIRISRA